MSRFEPSQGYLAEEDIRFANGEAPAWIRRVVEARPPNSAAWLVVMPRRAGKSWLAQAIDRSRHGGSTRLVDLRARDHIVATKKLGCLIGRKQQAAWRQGEVLLVDEPALAGPSGPGRCPEALAGGLVEARGAGAVPVVLLTPAEHALLAPHLGADAAKDVLMPPVLSDTECGRMAARAPQWAPDVVALLREHDPAWLQTPFLLELVLRMAEDLPELRDRPADLTRAAAEEAIDRHTYIRQWFHYGLTAGHRAGLRALRWQAAGLPEPPGTPAAATATATELRKLGLTTDPVLRHHMPEVLRIHHISDLHHGGRLRSTVDAKDTSQAGKHLAALSGAGSPLSSYLDQVRQLAAHGRAPHLVIVTGDLVERPHAVFGEQARTWLSELSGLLAEHPDLGPDDPRVLLAGGNHDVSWDLTLDPDPHARHRWFAAEFDGYPHPDLQLADHAERRLYIRYPRVGLRVALLGSAESGGEPARDEDYEALRQARERFVAGDMDAAGLSALIMEFERHDPGVIARPVLDRLAAEPGVVTLAALHHPLSPVAAVEVAPYSGVVNAGQAKLALAVADTSLVLHGHTHLAFTAAERFPAVRPQWTMRVTGAPALGSQESDEPNGYNEVFIAREGDGYGLALRTVRLTGGQWTAPAWSVIGFRPGVADECGLDGLCQDR